MPSSWSYEKQLNKSCSPRSEGLGWKWALLVPVSSFPSVSEAQGHLEQWGAGWWLTQGHSTQKRRVLTQGSELLGLSSSCCSYQRPEL